MYEGTRVKLFVQSGSSLEGTILFVDSHTIKLKDVKFHENPPRSVKELSLKASDLKDLQVLLPEGTPSVNNPNSTQKSSPKVNPNQLPPNNNLNQPNNQSLPNNSAQQKPQNFQFPPPPPSAAHLTSPPQENVQNNAAWSGKNDNVLMPKPPTPNVVPMHHPHHPLPPSNLVLTPPIHHHHQGSPAFHHVPNGPPQHLPHPQPFPPLVDPAIVSMSGNAPRMQGMGMPLSHIPHPSFNGVSQLPPQPLQPINLNDLLPQFNQQQEESLKQAPLPQVQSVSSPAPTQSPKKSKKPKENSGTDSQNEKKQKGSKKKVENNNTNNNSNINYFNMNDVLNSITSESVANTKHLEPGEIQIRNPSPSKRAQPSTVNSKKISKQDKSTFVQRVDGEEIDEDFDFVGNNAKFDKKEVYTQMLSEVNFSEAPTEESEEVPEDKVPKKNFTLEDGSPVSAVTSSQSKSLFSSACEEGISLSILVENAGRSLCEFAFKKFLEGKSLEERSKFKILVLVGVGNTGCVGLAAARHLANRNVNVVISRSRAYQLPDESTNQRKFYQSCNGGKEAQLGSLPVEKVDLIIDALIGVGLRGTPVAPTSTLIQWANANGAPILSVDVPSGVDGTTGDVTSCAIKANYTLALGLPKTGLNEEQAGELWLSDTGVPNGLVSKFVQNQPNFGGSFLVKLRY
eukprot:TRINITY_DN1606_c0_g5_i1.p1 TRINITY_DN1606_c0_g5~~TRINITY_DN1606_c0_g5_i1.p1  ORF type:complete len:681 (-),score=275.25 TRINITY_DN1606_c0_g5_i1:33-2075(-)